MFTRDLLELVMSAGALAGVLATAVIGALGWRWQRHQLLGIQGEFGRLAHLRTSGQQRRSEVAAEALGATIRYAVVLKRAGEAPAALAAGTVADPASASYLREALERSWSEIAPIERRFEQAWDQALVYLDDDRASDLMERLWRLKETRHKEQLAGIAGEPSLELPEEGEGRGASGSPGLLGGPEFERYIQFVEAIDDIVREAKEVIRPLVRPAAGPSGLSTAELES